MKIMIMLVFGLYNTHGYTRSDDVIKQLLLSSAIPGVSFNFIAYEESSPKKFLTFNKNPKFLKG